MTEFLTGLFQALIFAGVLAAVLAAIWQDSQRGVPGMGAPYPATERDEDSESEYAREDAPLLQEDRR